MAKSLPRVSLLEHDPGFLGRKKELIQCDMVIAARMHCAINALTAHLPTILVAYSRKSESMCQYVYGNSNWLIPLNEFVSGTVLNRVRDLLRQKEQIRSYLAKRITEIQEAAYGPGKALKEILENNKSVKCISQK